MAVGRISGPLLKSNLLRDGVNLAFENDLLVLDVNNDKVGIKLGLNNADQDDPILPQHELDVNGTSKTTNLIVDTQADLANITISGNTIQSSNDLNLVTTGIDTVVYQKQLDVQDISIYDNIVSTNNSNANLELRPNGTGIVDVFSDMNVTGNIHATGNITADGNIQLGSTDQTVPNDDTVTFNAEIASDLIPDQDDTYQLGTAAKRWADIYVENFIATQIDTGDLFVDGIDLSLRQGNIIYVATNGDDTHTGTHPQDPVASIKYAVETLATAGDTIHVFPGTYTETFPIELPVGVNIKGESLRSVNVQPTVATQDNDAFLLNGETTIEDITVSNYFYNSVNDTGYAFRFASNFEVTTRSPYIKNITVITEGSVTSASDPRGFDQGDAGKGVLVDGSVATANSKEASMLFHSATFITPGVDAITATNGARIEWLNSFTYFANRSIYAYDSSAGLQGDGKTALRVSDVTGSFSAGETVTYYDTDGVTVLATGTIETVDADGKFYIDAKNVGWELPEERPGKTVTANGDAQIDSTKSKFGIGSLVLDGTGDYITVASIEDFEFGTGDFTIEMFVYFDAVAGTLYDQRTTASQAVPVIYVNGSGNFAYYVNGAEVITGTSTPTTSTWYHVAVTKEGTNTKLFVDGTQEGSTWTDNTTYVETGVRIGSAFDDTSFIDGNIDEVRVVKGEAKYTANFTTTTTPFLGEQPGTVLLLHFDDISGSTNIVDDGVSGQDVRFSGGATATRISLVDFSDFGAEIRLIGSASVYGNEGLVGDGPGVIMYAIGHNVAYIGNGKEVDNDPNTVIQANEIVETNNAKIYYSTVDHKGDFRVGDLFVIDQENGAIQFSNASFNIDTTNGIEITDGTNTTLIKGDKIETGNWRLSGNTLETLSGDANITAASGQINLQDNVDITGNLDVVGDVTVAGNIQIGDQSTDSISFTANIDSGMFPTTTDTYDLGSPSLRWRDLWANRLYIDSIEINDNYIQTIDSNADLELRANGTGEVIVPNNDVTITNNLVVQGTTTVQDLTINSDLTVNGAVDITGDVDVTGSVSLTETLTVDGAGQFEDIRVEGNVVTTTLSNSDLELRANGTGFIQIPNNDVIINNNLTVVGLTAAHDVVVNNNIVTDTFTTGDILIDNNTITTTLSNSDLVLRANGAGEIHVDTNDVVLGQALTVAGATDVQALTVNGDITHNGNVTQTGDVDITGDLTVTGVTNLQSQVQFENILIDDNYITTTVSNSDLELRASGTGIISIPNNDVIITNDLSVTNQISANTVDVTTTVDAITYNVSDITITNNVITTASSNANLELAAAGAGNIVANNDVVMQLGLEVRGDTDLLNTVVVGTITHAGDTTQTGNLTVTGNMSTTGTLDVTQAAQFEEILIDDNYITTTTTNADLELRAAGTGEVIVPNNDVTIQNNLTVSGTVTTPNLIAVTSITSPLFTTGDINIFDNVIETTTSNSNLELRAAGTGTILVDSNNVQFDNNLTVNGTTQLATTNINGLLTHAGNTNQTGDYDLIGDLSISGILDVQSAVQLEEILIEDNFITTTSSNADLELRAAGTGKVIVPSNDVEFLQNVEVTTGTLTTQDIISATITSNLFSTGDIDIFNNTISTTLSNSDLILDASGTGSVVIPTSNVSITNDLTVSGLTTLDNTVINGTITHTGNYFQTGNATINGDYTINGLFSINAEMQFENILINDNFITTTASNSDLELRAAGTGVVLVPTNDVLINNNLEVLGITTTENIDNAGLITSGSFETAKIRIINDLIKTINPGDNLILEANGVGIIQVNSDLRVSNDLTVTGNTDLQDTTITGTLTQIGGTSQTGDFDLTGNLSIDGNLTALSQAQFEDILIDDNFITTTLSNSDLDLRANGTGVVLVPSNDVEITNDLTVGGTINSGAIVNAGAISSSSFTTGDISLIFNIITTTQSNSDLELRASGTGKILVPSSDVYISNDLTVVGTTTTSDINATGLFNHIGNTQQTGTYTVTGAAIFNGNINVQGTSTLDDIVVANNVISIDPAVTNTDLILRPQAGGEVIIDQNDLSITGDILAPTSNINSNTINNTGIVTSGSFNTGTITITGNTVSSTADIDLVANPGNVVRIQLADVEFDQDLTVLGTTTLNDLNVNGTLTHNGDYTQTGNTTINGNINVGGSFDVEGAFQFEEILIDDNFITTTRSNANLELGANGTGEILVPTNNVRILQDLTVEGTLFTNSLISSNSFVSSDTFSTGDIIIEDNYITTTNSNSNLELRASGTGSIDFGDISINQSTITVAPGNDLDISLGTGNIVNFDSTESIVLPSGTTADRPATPVAGMVRFNTDIGDYEGYDGTSWSGLGGVFDDDRDTYITAELTPGANDGVIRFYSNGSLAASLDGTGLNTPRIEIDNILIENTSISAVNTNTDMSFQANGTGSVVLENFAINESTITNTAPASNMEIVQTGTGYLKFGDAEGFVIPVGTSLERPPVPQTGVTRFNTTDSRVEVYDGQNWVSVAGSASGISRADAEDLALEIVLSLG
ncbi:MAG: LamG-like jellyroll fold domain-containing protein [Euryarchaeota archaeon]|jgi:cytoskeletal protein CcmA (bactofilin family)